MDFPPVPLFSSESTLSSTTDVLNTPKWTKSAGQDSGDIAAASQNSGECKHPSHLVSSQQDLLDASLDDWADFLLPEWQSSPKTCRPDRSKVAPKLVVPLRSVQDGTSPKSRGSESLLSSWRANIESFDCQDLRQDKQCVTLATIEGVRGYVEADREVQIVDGPRYAPMSGCDAYY